MNETELKDLFSTAVQHPKPDRLDTDAILRHGRRRRSVRIGTRLSAALVGAAVVGYVGFAPQPELSTVTVAEGVEPISVTCSPSGITVSGSTVTATSRGIDISVSSTLPAGSSLNFTWPGGGWPGGAGGDPLPPASTKATWTLLAPPGPLTLSCGTADNAKTYGKRTITVADPENFWRSTTLADTNCPKGSILDWPGDPGSGATPEAAVNELLPRLSTDGRALTATRAPIGYPDAASQVWIASFVNAEPYMLIGVGPSSSGFTASTDILCAS